MGKQIAATFGGVHKTGKKLFLTGEDLCHHKVKKAFLTVSGAHRLVYSSEVVWEKYSCEVSYGEYFPDSDNSLIGTEHTMSTEVGDVVYGDYEFSSSEGFVGIDPVTVESEEDAIGRYIVTAFEVYEIIDMWNTETADVCGQYEDSYSRGSESYGTVEADEGSQPEAGELVAHSREDGTEFYVLEIDGELYYYIAN